MARGEISTTEVCEAEREQPKEQHKGIISRLSDLHDSLGVPDGLIELAELREHYGKKRSTIRLIQCWLSVLPAFGTQMAFELADVAPKQYGRIGELAPGEVCQAKIGTCENAIECSSLLCAMVRASYPNLRAAS
jgi:hypothetical protein